MTQKDTSTHQKSESYEPYKLVFSGEKFVCIPERVKDLLKSHSHIEFEFKSSKFAIIRFDDFLLLLDSWKKRLEKT